MTYRPTKLRLSIFLPLYALALILTGCGGGGGGTEKTQVAVASQANTSTTQESSATTTSEAASSLASSTSSSVEASSSTAPIKSSSSSSSSSYVRASRASSSSNSFPDDDKPDEPDEPDGQFDLPPTAPTAAHLDVVSANSAIISWQPSTDDIGVSRYEIRRDGIVAGTTTATKLTFEDTTLTQNTYYTYTVRAIDGIGNRSNFSNAVIAKTLAGSSSSISSQAASSIIASSSSTTTSSSASNSSTNSQSSSSNTSKSSSVPNSSSASSRSISSSSSRAALNAVQLEWNIPSRRENGTYLELDEIDGYELRHKPANSATFTSQIIANASTRSISIANATQNDTFEIAVFDTNGLYSRFVSLTPR